MFDYESDEEEDEGKQDEVTAAQEQVNDPRPDIFFRRSFLVDSSSVNSERQRSSGVSVKWVLLIATENDLGMKFSEVPTSPLRQSSEKDASGDSLPTISLLPSTATVIVAPSPPADEAAASTEPKGPFSWVLSLSLIDVFSLQRNPKSKRSRSFWKCAWSAQLLWTMSSTCSIEVPGIIAKSRTD